MRRKRHRRPTRGAVDRANYWAVLVSTFAAIMMAIVVEVYYADLIPGTAVPQKAHIQAFAAACAGFLPTMLCLERLSAGTWLRALCLTAPWLLLVPDALVASLGQPRWYFIVLVTLLLSIVAWLSMLRIAHRQYNS